MMSTNPSNTPIATTTTNSGIMNNNNNRLHTERNVPQLDGGLRVMTLDEQREKRKKVGLCVTCGEVRTHKPGLWKAWMPDTVEGLVYKGICLKCNTMGAAKMTLGEPITDTPNLDMEMMYQNDTLPNDVVNSMSQFMQQQQEPGQDASEAAKVPCNNGGSNNGGINIIKPKIIPSANGLKKKFHRRRATSDDQNNRRRLPAIFDQRRQSDDAHFQQSSSSSCDTEDSKPLDGGEEEEEEEIEYFPDPLAKSNSKLVGKKTKHNNDGAAIVMEGDDHHGYVMALPAGAKPPATKVVTGNKKLREQRGRLGASMPETYSSTNNIPQEAQYYNHPLKKYDDSKDEEESILTKRNNDAVITHHKKTSSESLPKKNVEDFRYDDGTGYGFYTGTAETIFTGTCSVGGTMQEDYLPSGRGEMVYDDGHIAKGVWSKGVLKVKVAPEREWYEPCLLEGYSLGDFGRKEDIMKATLAEITKLHVGDCAWIRRSNGSWSYAILKSRSDGDGDVSMTFRINSRSSTKTVPIKQWVGHVRLPAKPDIHPHYALGDPGNEEDMIIASKKDTVKSVSLLRINDAAWVRRSDGSWSYALVTNRTNDDTDDPTITFKINARGSTKSLQASQSGRFVRRIRHNNQKGLSDKEAKAIFERSSRVPRESSHLSQSMK